MGMIGIEMTSLSPCLRLYIKGHGLSGSLQHFAGGTILLIYKPFKKGYHKAQNIKGIVKE
jgi:small conductance mechanosensitive channel